MDYYEMQSLKSKENSKEFIKLFKKILNSLEIISRYRYEMIIKLLLDKRIIDTESEINELVEHKYQEPVHEIMYRLPLYSDVNDGFISTEKTIFKARMKDMNNLLESELEFILNRLEDIEHRTSISKPKDK